jgi:hypothetical protein
MHGDDRADVSHDNEAKTPGMFSGSVTGWTALGDLSALGPSASVTADKRRGQLPIATGGGSGDAATGPQPGSARSLKSGKSLGARSASTGAHRNKALGAKTRAAPTPESIRPTGGAKTSSSYRDDGEDGTRQLPQSLQG